MRSHWFTILNLTGIVFLGVAVFAGNVFGGELQWKKPGNNESEGSAVIRIPAVITTNESAVPTILPSPVKQVQAILPIQPPAPPMPQERPVPPMAPVIDQRYLDTQPQPLPIPPGAATQQAPPPLPPQDIPIRTGQPATIPCHDQIPLKSIREISYDIRTKSATLPVECERNSVPFDGRHFSQSCVQWKASALCTKGAYFEDVQLERYGHTVVCPVLQPIVSGAKFFATVPLLPYKMGVTPPNECVYTLGHYRSGSRSPYMAQPIPISARGALLQAGAVAGGVAIIP